jgi:pyruvate dehydrogenase E2 component (dihydrolipoamide acetyltransferase)
MGMQEGTVVEWLKAEGDTVDEDEPIVEVEAEKTTDAVRAPVAGVLGRIVVPQGQTARIYDVLAVITAPGEAIPAPPRAPGAAPTKATAPAATTAPAKASATQAEPRARRAALEHGVDIETVNGTGPNGRITEEDVLRAARPSAGVRSSKRLTGARAVTARRMAEAARTVAPVTLTRDIDVAAVVARAPNGSGGVSASITDVVVRAVAVGLGRHPALNAHLVGDVLTIWESAHVGVAVATDDALFVPVIRNAESKTVDEIAKERRDLTEQVQAGTARPEQLSGSSFTVTNLGMFDIDAFTPIVNPPEVGILGVGRVREGHVATFSLTFDHRALDGAPAARFLQTLAELLGDPSRLVVSAS